MKAPRLRRDAREMRKEREKREVEKNKKRKKKRNAGSSPAPSAALQAAPAPIFRVWPAGWRSGSRTEEVEGVGKVVG